MTERDVSLFRGSGHTSAAIGGDKIVVIVGEMTSASMPIVRWSFCGVSYDHRIGGAYEIRLVIVPCWAAATVLGALPILRVVRWLRAPDHERRGLCPACGYDLRATPARCPECGATPPAAQQPATLASQRT